jgi:hypothetical protein
MEAFVPRRNAMSILRMTDLDLAGKRVLIREDLNVPVKDGRSPPTSASRASCRPCGWRWTAARR